jgi:hypothetical protein
MSTETIYIDRDNKFDLLLKIDDVVADLSNVTKIGLLFQENYYHSDNWPDAFDYSTQATAGIITFDMASLPATSFPAGRDKKTELIVYDSTNPQGIVWGTFDLHVKELEGTEVTP